MAYLIYNKETTRIVRSGKTYYATEGAAKAALTRLVRNGTLEGYATDYAVADAVVFSESIEKKVIVTNLMSGQQVTQSVNTPRCCDVSSEAYWSM